MYRRCYFSVLLEGLRVPCKCRRAFTQTHTQFHNYRCESICMWHRMVHLGRLTINVICQTVRATTCSLSPNIHYLKQIYIRCWIWGSHSGGYEEFSVSWGITPCTLVKVNRRFGWTHRFYLEGGRVNQARNQLIEAGSKQNGLLLGLFFDPEDGVNVFFRNVGCL
jgi:hypothetical protein